MSPRSYIFLACSSRVNIFEPAFYFGIMSILTVSQVKLHSFQIHTAMLDSKLLNTSLIEVIVYSKNAHVFICDLSNVTLNIILNAWWAYMNVGSTHYIAWDNSRYAPSWHVYLHCGIEETGHPGIIWIICHQVLRYPSGHGTSSLVKHLLAISHIAMLNNLTEWEVTALSSSTVDETALAIVKR